MKKILLISLIILNQGLWSQILQENVYPNGSSVGVNTTPVGNLQLIQLSTSGYKYVTKTLSSITLYNLNHTVFKSFTPPSIPVQGCTYCALNIFGISEQLFDNNPATVEYMWYYSNANNIGVLKVLNENGTLLFSKDSLVFGGGGISSPGLQDFISYTPNGVKMILHHSKNGSATVYSLPGVLPCHACTNGLVSGMASAGSIYQEDNLINYPNPASEQTTIAYELPKGTSTGEIVIYSLTGIEVKRYTVTDAFKEILISVNDISAGTYYYQLQTSAGYKAGKKMVVVK